MIKKDYYQNLEKGREEGGREKGKVKKTECGIVHLQGFPPNCMFKQVRI